MTTPPRRVLAVAAVLSLTAFLGACATSVGGAGSTGSSTPAPRGDDELSAAWLDDGRAVGVVTWGSSTCVPMAGEPTYADGVLTVELIDPEAQACTKDIVPRGTPVTLPEGVDATKDLKIAVTGAYAGDTDLGGDATLTAKPGDMTEYLPSAGWFDDSGFLLLSWGSSGCVPQLKSVGATGDAEVTATFVTPPADQVCTADMAPRITTVSDVTGVEAKTGVQLVLVGDDFDNVRLPIAGSR